MKAHRNLWRLALGALISSAIAMAAPAAAPPSGPPPVGTLNYLEDSASIDGEAMNQSSVGTAVIGPGQVLDTANGRAEVLLTPGVFLRMGNNSEIRMISTDPVDTEVALLKGEATVEADNFTSANRLLVDQGSAQTSILKPGLYLLHPGSPYAQVLDGKVRVSLGDKHVNIGKDNEAVLNPKGELKSHNFNQKIVADNALLRWSRIRSQSEAQANMEVARNMAVNNGEYYGSAFYGPYWYGPGWYWDAGFGYWAFLPGDGILYSPFGWGFYSPAFIYGAPGFHGHGYFGRGYYGHPSRGFAPRSGFRGGFAAPRTGGGFHGGFRSGGGGFHGGGGRR